MAEQKPEYKVSGSQLHVFDEATTGAAQLAEIVGVYYQTLIAAKVPKSLANELTFNYQVMMLESALGRKSEGGE